MTNYSWERERKRSSLDLPFSSFSFVEFNLQKNILFWRFVNIKTFNGFLGFEINLLIISKLGRLQCDQIWLLLKALGYIFSYKLAQLFGLVWNMALLSHNCLGRKAVPGPWWWSSGQRACLLLCRSKFESLWRLQYFLGYLLFVCEKNEIKQ